MVIRGKSIAEEPILIDYITIESGNVIVEGEVFDVDYKIFNNNKGVITFNITDYSNSITVKVFETEENIQQIKTALSNRKFIKVKGDINLTNT